MNKLIKIGDINKSTIDSCHQITIEQNISSKIKLQRLKEIIVKSQQDNDQNIEIDEEKKSDLDEHKMLQYELMTNFNKAKFIENLNSSLNIGFNSELRIDLRKDDVVFDGIKKYEILKFSKNLRTENGWKLTDDDQCATVIKFNSDYNYILLSAVPVNTGIHCWTIKV